MWCKPSIMRKDTERRPRRNYLTFSPSLLEKRPCGRGKANSEYFREIKPFATQERQI